MCERDLDCPLQLLRLFDPDAADAHGLCHQRKIRVLEITARVQESVSLHLHFDKTERAVVEDDYLHRKPHLGEGDEISHHHAEAAVA